MVRRRARPRCDLSPAPAAPGHAAQGLRQNGLMERAPCTIGTGLHWPAKGSQTAR